MASFPLCKRTILPLANDVLHAARHVDATYVAGGDIFVIASRRTGTEIWRNDAYESRDTVCLGRVSSVVATYDGRFAACSHVTPSLTFVSDAQRTAAPLPGSRMPRRIIPHPKGNGVLCLADDPRPHMCDRLYWLHEGTGYDPIVIGQGGSPDATCVSTDGRHLAMTFVRKAETLLRIFDLNTGQLAAETRLSHVDHLSPTRIAFAGESHVLVCLGYHGAEPSRLRLHALEPEFRRWGSPQSTSTFEDPRPLDPRSDSGHGLSTVFGSGHDVAIGGDFRTDGDADATRESGVTVFTVPPPA